MRKVYLFVLYVMCCEVAFAQVMILSDYLQEERVGLVDEFFERFNKRDTIACDSVSIAQRKLDVAKLFDFTMFTSDKDPRIAQAYALIDSVVDNSLTISYDDSDWTAVARCKCSLSGKPVDIDLFLNVEQRGTGMYKWVISSVYGKLFDTAPISNSSMLMIMPDAHETNFMELGEVTANQPENISRFMDKDFGYDNRSVFVYLVHSGKLKIQHVEDLEFVFTQVPGWVFSIKYHDRQSSNSGWLISQFVPKPAAGESLVEWYVYGHGKDNRYKSK